MKKCMQLIKYYTKDLLIRKKKKRMKEYSNTFSYNTKQVALSSLEINALIYEKIISNEPLCVARFGSTELFCASVYEFDIKSKKQKAMKQLEIYSGFFPTDMTLGDSFNRCIIRSCNYIDVLGIWALRFEEYYIKYYMKHDLITSFLYNIEPWSNPDMPWSKALKGKKVLVIHPFEETIKSQYDKRDKIFPGTEILPEFELKTLKAVQTVAGVRDERFASWFDALDYMYNEAMKIDYDIAIIGCGAYGLPLAAQLKEQGKQAIHLGGATQILFGIKGKRWDEEEDKDYVRKFYNEHWVYPSDNERPQNATAVEGGCYW